jgi:hypothetical protein
MMDYSDLMPVQDQLAMLAGPEIDILIETPGGIAEVAEDIVRAEGSAPENAISRNQSCVLRD